jgi:hypothetical protein
MSGITDTSLNTLLSDQRNGLKQDIDTIIQKTKYVSDSAASLMIINKVLFFVYACLFIIILIGFLNRLFRNGIAKLNLGKEIGILFLILLFPFVADTIEKTAYSLFMYLYSMVTGTIYINRFDKLFNVTDFYYNPRK